MDLSTFDSISKYDAQRIVPVLPHQLSLAKLTSLVNREPSHPSPALHNPNSFFTQTTIHFYLQEE
jgi:hypothetical protein